MMTHLMNNKGHKISDRIYRSGRVFIHGQSAVPYQLVENFVSEVRRRKDSVDNLEFIHLHVEGIPAHAQLQDIPGVRVNNLFVGSNIRSLVDYEHVDYTPVFLSEIPRLFRSGKLPIDVALVQLSPPDRFGYCTLGVGVDVARAAVDTAKVVMAQINPRMPRVHGDSLVHISRIDHSIEVDAALPEIDYAKNSGTPEMEAIGRNVASLIENGSTLQLGIGSIPDAVLKSLHSHQNLGIHSEMCSDGIVELLQKGVINNTKKVVHPGMTVSSFIQGTKKIYDFIHENPSVELYPSCYVNSPTVIARNPKVVAINSAVEVDLTGQVCADSVGHRMVSGVGGQIDFIRGASMCEDGKPIIAMTSRSKRGEPRIVAELRIGAGVVTTRADVHYVVTEYGVADLNGKSIGSRVKALISIAHPDDRESLSRTWHSAKSRLL